MEVDVRSRQRNRLVNTNYTSKKKRKKTGSFGVWHGRMREIERLGSGFKLKNVNSRVSLKRLKVEADTLLLGQMERSTRPRPRLSKKAIARLPIVLAIAPRVIT